MYNIDTVDIFRRTKLDNKDKNRQYAQYDKIGQLGTQLTYFYQHDKCEENTDERMLSVCVGKLDNKDKNGQYGHSWNTYFYEQKWTNRWCNAIKNHSKLM